MKEYALHEIADEDDRISSISRLGETSEPLEQQGDYDSAVVAATHRSDSIAIAGRPGETAGPDLPAAARIRSDWADPILGGWYAEGLYELTREERRVVGAAWTDLAVQAHHRLGKICRLTVWLLKWAAPWELIARAQRASLEATRSAEQLFGLASTLSGNTLGPGPYPSPSEPPPVIEDVSFALLDEASSFSGAAAACRLGACSAQDEEIAGVLAQIARREQRVADLYLLVLRWIVCHHPRARSSLTAGLDHEHRLLAVSQPEPTDWPVAHDLLEAYGIVPQPGNLSRAVFRQTVGPKIADLLAET